MEPTPSLEANRFPASQEIPSFYGTRRSLPNSQVPAPCSSPELEESSPTPTFHFLKIHLNIILPPMMVLPNTHFHSGFPTKTLSTPLVSPYTLQTNPMSLFSPLPRRIIFGEGYRSLSSSWYSSFPWHIVRMTRVSWYSFKKNRLASLIFLHALLHLKH